ncbi:hypothetical protein ACFUNF_40235 [Streptomyces sp. NPDC057291]|uniref:hypothetical protein n=1 Tax=Streptomyces sp. NPDC057291 TaxID=3346087 RepID=UPI00363BE1D2
MIIDAVAWKYRGNNAWLGLLLCLPAGDPRGCRSADGGADDTTEEPCKSCVHGVILLAKRRALPVGRDCCAWSLAPPVHVRPDIRLPQPVVERVETNGRELRSANWRA